MSSLIICLPLGHSFDFFTFSDILANVKFIYWPDIDSESRISQLADTIIEQNREICNKADIILGISIAGLLAIEIANKKENIQKVILISSIKSAKEKPNSFKIFKFIRLYNILPISLLNGNTLLMQFIYKLWYLSSEKNATKYYQKVIKNEKPQQIRKTLRLLFAWNGQLSERKKVLHIHGTNDQIFPIRKLHNVEIIDKAEHFNIMLYKSKIISLINAFIA